MHIQTIQEEQVSDGTAIRGDAELQQHCTRPFLQSQTLLKVTLGSEH